MNESRLGDQQGWWNFRARQASGEYGASLVLDPEEMDFQERHIQEGGETLVLGATRSLASLALKKHAIVTAVDIADEAIAVSRLQGVHYVLADWNEYLEQETGAEYDNIVTDGGMLCLDFPDSWQRIAGNISNHLRPGGIFAAKFYASKPEPLTEYRNPNLGRFMNIPAHEEEDWKIVPAGPDYEQFKVRYTLPPLEVVRQTFEEAGQLDLIEIFTPGYEAGDRFPSVAWRRPVV
jgi:SAM-dependent methyltransferase